MQWSDTTFLVSSGETFQRTINKSCGLVPYLCWLLFATWLNLAICRLNPTANGYNNAAWQAGLSKLQKRAASIAFAAS